jgi:hypothetical protein
MIKDKRRHSANPGEISQYISRTTTKHEMNRENSIIIQNKIAKAKSENGLDPINTNYSAQPSAFAREAAQKSSDLPKDGEEEKLSASEVGSEESNTSSLESSSSKSQAKKKEVVVLSKKSLP